MSYYVIYPYLLWQEPSCSFVENFGNVILDHPPVIVLYMYLCICIRVCYYSSQAQFFLINNIILVTRPHTHTHTYSTHTHDVVIATYSKQVKACPAVGIRSPRGTLKHGHQCPCFNVPDTHSWPCFNLSRDGSLHLIQIFQCCCCRSDTDSTIANSHYMRLKPTDI